MHSVGILNADLGMRNLFDFEGLRLKLGGPGASVFRDIGMTSR